MVTFGVLGERQGRRRALVALFGTFTLVAGYLVIRHGLGSVAGGYAGLG